MSRDLIQYAVEAGANVIAYVPSLVPDQLGGLPIRGRTVMGRAVLNADYELDPLDGLATGIKPKQSGDRYEVVPVKTVVLVARANAGSGGLQTRRHPRAVASGKARRQGSDERGRLY